MVWPGYVSNAFCKYGSKELYFIAFACSSVRIFAFLKSTAIASCLCIEFSGQKGTDHALVVQFEQVYQGKIAL